MTETRETTERPVPDAQWIQRLCERHAASPLGYIQIENAVVALLKALGMMKAEK